LTENETANLRQLESLRAAILREEEFSWRLRSRATWLKLGDTNSSYFHKVASFNRNKKSIWSIESADAGLIRGQNEIKAEAVSHFSSLYKDTNNHNLREKVTTAGLFPAWSLLRKPVIFTSLSLSLN
jgi:hypothetical protein